MLRTLLGAVLGVVVAMLTITAVEYLGHQVYPPPPGLNPMDPADMERILGLLPAGAKWFVVAAWTCGALLGGLVAALVARHPRIAALVPALLVMTGVVMVSLQMPGHPRWMAVAGLLLPIPAALLGATLAARLRRRPVAR
ncbi:hypothetical protein MASR1M8_21220 [Thermomonas brevis]